MEVPRNIEPKVNFKLAPGERLLYCPYNTSHYFLNKKTITHLVKCRKAYETDCKTKGIPMDIQICQYSYKHHLPSNEMQEHENTCAEKPAEEVQSMPIRPSDMALPFGTPVLASYTRTVPGQNTVITVNRVPTTVDYDLQDWTRYNWEGEEPTPSYDYMENLKKFPSKMPPGLTPSEKKEWQAKSLRRVHAAMKQEKEQEEREEKARAEREEKVKQEKESGERKNTHAVNEDKTKVKTEQGKCTEKEEEKPKTSSQQGKAVVSNIKEEEKPQTSSQKGKAVVPNIKEKEKPKTSSQQGKAVVPNIKEEEKPKTSSQQGKAVVPNIKGEKTIEKMQEMRLKNKKK